MTSETNIINIDQCSKQQLEALIRRRFPGAKICFEVEEHFADMGNSRYIAHLSQRNTQPQTAVIASGKQLNIESGNIDYEKFDIILNIPQNTLCYRQDPANHTELKEANLENIGSRRISFLIYLLKHPSRFISIDNLHCFYKHSENIGDANTLAKTISLLRRALGNSGKRNPYILTKKSFGDSPYVYKLNLQWSYLLIEQENH